MVPVGPMFSIDELEQAEHVAFEEIEFAVHIGFGQRQHRIEGDGPLGARAS